MDVSYTISMALIGLIVALLIFSLPAFRFIDEETEVSRSNSLDGMRFLLASFVIFHHLDCLYSYITRGAWSPSSVWLTYLGKYGVALFFMTTAYLFWGKVRSNETVDWVDLYKKRFFRIVPLATACSFVGLVLLFSLTEHGPITFDVVPKIMSWFDGGLWNSKPDVTNFNKSWMALSGVTWTLRWEWMFYFTLPLLYLFKKWSMELTIVLFAFSVYLLPGFTRDAYLWSYFFSGMLCRELKDKIVISRMQANILLVAIVLVTGFAQPDLFRSPEKFFLCVIFFSVVSGADMFGLLATRAAKRLGAVSYSLYLTQGLILFPLSRLLVKDDVSHVDYKVVTLFIAAYILVCLISSMSYHFIERPFINKMKKAALSEINTAS
ncbi:acyltransferase family protein [Enterobacter kobei]|uniref:acyltransferase family protein n=1 Tax=Enterobacter kobei TaxID=208224 RepID=UPI0023AF8DCB|nr:acyltransferase [Enterobacter kobei]MDE7915320.1 acyltransferase [Enterobacter kobei]